MKIYEKPVVELVSFQAEEIMNGDDSLAIFNTLSCTTGFGILEA